MHNRKDNGESTFDQFRSPQSVEIFPVGGSDQRYMEAPTYNEQEAESLANMAQWSPEYRAKALFNLQNGEGGSTYVAGRELGVPAPRREDTPGPALPIR